MSVTTESAATTTLPAPGVWEIDPSHTTVAFVARHLMVTKVRGRFADVTGSLTVAEKPEDSKVEVRIGVASIDTRDTGRDEHLRSADFFDVERHPEITFRGSAIRRHGDGWVLEGDLTIRDLTRPVTLDVEFDGLVKDPWGGERAGFSASADVDREDWGLTWNVALEAGGVLVSRKVRIELDVELVRK